MSEELKSMATSEKTEVSSLPAVVPARRGRGIDLSKLTPEQLTLHKRSISTNSARARASKKKASSFVYDSKIEPTKSEAKEILTARGLRNPHVINTCYDLGLIAAEQMGVTPNRFFFLNGVSKTRASYEAQVPQALEAVLDEPVPGELSNRAELVCLHDFSITWREDAVDFTKFIYIRKLCKSDAYELGLLLGKDWEECQKNWTEFLPRFNPDTLPPNYTQRQMRAWLDSTSEIKDYLLLASRNSMKSSFALNWLLTLHLCCPDARALLASETKNLSEGFIRSYRSYWEVKPNSDSVLHKFFPEYCIPVGKGSELSFESPMAHLDLIQSSASATSYESATVGNRADVLLNDDPISNMTVGTEAQRQKSVKFYDLLQKLREVSGSFGITIGTPWYADEDLYAVLLKRNEADDAKSLAFRIDPIVTVKPQARHKLTPQLLPTLTEDDVESYLLPVRMPWRFVKKEIIANPVFTLSQNFIIFPKENDEGLRVTFTEDDLRAHLRRREFFGSHLGVQCVMSLDRAYQTNMYSDFSAISVAKIMPVKANENAPSKTSYVVWDVRLDRWKESLLVKNIVDMMEIHKPTIFVAEKDKGYESLDLAIRKLAMLRGVPLPYMRWVNTSSGSKTPLQKAKRIKKLEIPLESNQLWFCSSGWDVDAVFAQFTKMDGGIFVSSNSHRKLDAPDCISLGYEQFMPRVLTEPVDQKNAEQREAEEREEWERERRRAYHERIVNGGQPVDNSMRHSEWQRQQRGEPQFPEAPAPTPQQPARRFPSGAGNLNILPPGMRGINRR